MLVLCVNPGSTSTKIAVFENETAHLRLTIQHSAEELAGFSSVQEQLSFRRELIEKTLAAHGYDTANFDAFSARGGGLYPGEGGVYAVTDLVVLHASEARSGGEHPAQLASQICKFFSDKTGKPAFIVNPPDTDEFWDVSRITGLKGIYRHSRLHALNQKECAIRYCKLRGLQYEKTNLIVMHLGGGISISAHCNGRIVDSNDIIGSTGPVTPTRAGDIPPSDIIELAYSGIGKDALISRLRYHGGFEDLLGTSELREVLEIAASGGERAASAELVFRAFAYQCAKSAGAMAAALCGNVQGIIITGGMANSRDLIGILRQHLDWIAEIEVMPGEFEMEALAAGAMRVLTGEEEAKTYTGIMPEPLRI